MPQKKKKRSASSKETTPTTTSTLVVQAEDEEQVDSTQIVEEEEEAAPQRDLLACLEQLDELIRTVSMDRADCISGIVKADGAIEKCGSDDELQSAVRVKRAHLLKVMVEKKYSSSGLSSQHENPLESCIADCQQVLLGLRSDESSTMYKEAQAILSRVKKLKTQEDDPDIHTRGGSAVAKSLKTVTTPLYFDPAKTQFKDVSDIHPALLQDIVNCYKKYKYVCRTCFVRYNRQEIIVGGKPCRKCRNTTTTRIVPASKLCKNFRDLKVLAIPPPPKVLLAPTNRHKPFLYCRNTDHLLCYDRAKESWYAHSVDELVIWTVERHWRCSFTEYVSSHHSEISSATGGKNVNSKPKDMDNLDSFSEGPEYEFYPSETVFSRGVASIPKHLLDDVIQCYNKRREYCKLCFYKTGKKGEVSTGPQNSSMCSVCHRAWQRVIVIPASSLCWNFGDLEMVPVAPLPKSKSPTFKYCNNEDHFRCFRLYIENEFWYVHSVEEMVIWTVEKERECSFAQFVSKSQKPPPPGISLPSSPLTPLTPSTPLKSPLTRLQTTTSAGGKDGGQSTIISSSSPSFSQIVSGPPSKIKTPSVGKIKPGGGAKDKSVLSPDIDSISISSTNSGLDPVITDKSTSSTSSAPPSTSYNSSRNQLDSLPLPGQSGPHPTKIRRYSEESYMTALSQDTTASSQGNLELSQDSGNCAQGKSRTAPNAKSAKAQIRGRANYKVVKNDKMEDTKSESGRSNNENFHEVPLQKTEIAPVNTDPSVSSKTKFKPSRTVNGVLPSQLSAATAGMESVKSTTAGLATVKATNSTDFVSSKTTSVAHGDSDRVSTQTSNGSPAPLATVSAHAGRSVSHPPGFSSAVRGVSYPSRADTLVSSNQQGLTSRHSLTGSFSGAKNPKEVFKFLDVNFRTCGDVPLSLVVAIATAYEQRREVCRKCFFGERSLSYSSSGGGVCGESEHPWENPVTVIPGCRECDNEPCFDAEDHVPLPPLPPIANIRKCSQKNHHKCFQKSLDSNPKFAHSVEQLVVWLIESEKDCSFLEFINGELHSLLPPARPDSTCSHTTGGQSSTSEHHLRPAQVPRHISSSTTGATIPPKTSRPPPLNSHLQPLTPKYNSKNVVFQYLTDIPSDLLRAVAMCYNFRKVVCRQCFFGSGCRLLTAKSREAATSSSRETTLSQCGEGHNWKSVVVIPGCRLCSNASHGDRIPIVPIPPHMKTSASSFSICKRNHHQQCYQLSKGTNPWFPHTVEELVIWTIEKEKSVSFEKVYKSYLPAPDSGLTPEMVIHLPSSPSSASLPSPPSPPSASTQPATKTRTPSSSSQIENTTPQSPAKSTVVSDRGSVSGSVSQCSTAGGGDGVAGTGTSLVKAVVSEEERKERVNSAPSVTVATLKSTVDDVLVPDPSKHVPVENGNGTAVQLQSNTPPGITPSHVSLFHDPLMYYNSSTGTSVPVNENTGTYQDSASDATLNYFPALRANVDMETGQNTDGCNEPVSLGNDPVIKRVIDSCDVKNHVTDDTIATVKSSKLQEVSVVSGTDEQESGQTSPSVTSEKFENTDHNRYRSSMSSAMPENWPDVPRHGSPLREETLSPVGEQRLVSPSNNQGQGDSSSSRQGSSGCGNASEGSEEDDTEKDGVRLSNSVAVQSEVESDTSTTVEHETDRVSETEASSSSGNPETTTPPDTPTTSEPDSAAAATARARRDSLDVNAKVFTPRNVVCSSDPRSSAGPYPVGLNPNALSYPYLSNGGASAVPQPAEKTAGVGGNSGGGGRRKVVGKTVPAVEGSTTATVTANSPLPHPGSLDVSTSSPSLSPLSSPTHPQQCLLCYQAFQDTPSLRRHCKTPSHISTLLRDCGASTIWKHLPPPPGQPREHMKLCLNGQSCSLSRLDCSQPHFADEFAEQLRRIDHHSLRETTRKPLPEFSDQRDGLLVSPVEVERVTHYTTLRVSVGEPLQAVLNDASVSFTWTITVQGQNWQTLFGIHLKSPAPIFHITDLEDANTQASGNCKSDWANWVANSPADAILLGCLSFSVRATPDMRNTNYGCRVCLSLGFYQYAYISLALVVNDPKCDQKPSRSHPPPLNEYPPISEKARVISTTPQKRSVDKLRPTGPQSGHVDKRSLDQLRPQSGHVDKRSLDQQTTAEPPHVNIDQKVQAGPQSAHTDKRSSNQKTTSIPHVDQQLPTRPRSVRDKQDSKVEPVAPKNKAVQQVTLQVHMKGGEEVASGCDGGRGAEGERVEERREVGKGAGLVEVGDRVTQQQVYSSEREIVTEDSNDPIVSSKLSDNVVSPSATPSHSNSED